MAERDVVIRVKTEYVPPDMAPLTTAHQTLKGAHDDMFAAAHQELETLKQTVNAWREVADAAGNARDVQLKPEAGAGIPDMKPLAEGQAVDKHTAALQKESEARMDAQVAEAIEATNREKAINTILEEEDAVKKSGHAHESHGHSLTSMARPLTMVIHSTMHLAHSFALLTAANKEDEEQMVRSLMKYEGWIMGATGVLHMIHGMSHAYHALAQNATFAALAEAGALAPLAAVAAAAVLVGVTIYEIGDAFDWWGGNARRAAEESRLAAEAMDNAVKASKEFHKSRQEQEGHAFEQKVDIRAQTDPENNRPLDKLKANAEERIKLEKELGNQEAAAVREKNRHLRDQKDLEEELKESTKKRFGLSHDMSIELHPLDNVARADKKNEEMAINKQLAEQSEAEKQTAEGIAATQKEISAARQRDITYLKEQGDYLRDNLKAQHDAVKSAERELELAEDKIKKTNQGLGHLTEGQFDRAKEINAKVEAGEELDRSDLKFAEKHGLYGKQTGEQRERLGAERRKELGANSRSEDQERDAAESQAVNATNVGNNREGDNAAQLERKLAENRQLLFDAGGKAVEAVESVSTTIIDAVNRLTEKIEKLRFVLEQQKHEA